MIELPEALSIAADLRRTILHKTVIQVGGNFTDHKFTFYKGDPNQYDRLLKNQSVDQIVDRHFYIELKIGEYTLLFRDGANLRYYQTPPYPKKSKLMLIFEDGSCLNMTPSMYAEITLFKTSDDYDNLYYQLELNGVGPLDEKFTWTYFKRLLDEKTLKLSTKAFLVTDQRILGVGNGHCSGYSFSCSSSS